MTVSSDARTPSASVHALSGSTPPGSAPVMQPFGVATASAGVAEMPETFAPLGPIATGIADRLRPAHPDAAVIDLAGRVERLVKRELDLILRVVNIEDAIMTAMPPRPEKAEGVLQMTCERSVEDDGTRVTTIREPAGWAAETAAKREAHEAALAARERVEEEEGIRRGLPLLNKLRDRAVSRLERWGLQLAAMRPATQAGLKAKAAASMAVVEDGVLPDDWRQRLAVSVSEDALRIICAEAEARAEQDRQADGELLSLLGRLEAAAAECEALDEASRGPQRIYDDSKPERPAALYWSASDRTRPAGRVRVPGSDASWHYVYVYDAEDVERLRDRPAVQIVEHFRPADWNPEDTIVRREYVPDEPGEARRQEILASWDAWQAQDAALRESTGLNAANALVDAASDACNAIEDAILEAAPRTVEGLLAKARWIAEKPRSDLYLNPLFHDLTTMRDSMALPQSNIRPVPLAPLEFPAGRYPAGTSREVIETYRTFLDRELRYLNHEIYGRTEGRMHLWLDNPAGALHGPREPGASTRAAAVLSLLGLMPTEGVHGKAQADGLAHAAASAA